MMKYLVLAGLMSAAVAQPTAVIAKELTGSHHPNNSLRADPDKMKWWDEAKFGMFIHWGVYSRLEGAWNGESIPVYAEHIKRTAEIPLDVYRDETLPLIKFYDDKDALIKIDMSEFSDKTSVNKLI